MQTLKKCGIQRSHLPGLCYIYARSTLPSAGRKPSQLPSSARRHSSQCNTPWKIYPATSISFSFPGSTTVRNIGPMVMDMQESHRIMFGYPESPESSPGGSFSRGLEIPGGPPMEGGLEELQNTIMAPFLYPFVEERNPAHPSGHSSFTRPSSGTCIYTSQGIQNGGYETWGCSQPTTQYIQPQNDFHLSRGTGQSIEHVVSFSFQLCSKVNTKTAR